MKCNENYFEVIDTEQKAYWLGFLYADGCVTQKPASVVLSLSIKDIEHIKLYKKCLMTDYNLGFGNNNKYVRLAIYKKKLVNDLIDKGCVPAKSLILKFPNEYQVPRCFIRHFIRGYFDGDGCVFARLRRKRNSNCIFLNTEVNFLGTNDFLQKMLSYLPINAKIEERSKDHIFALRIYDKKAILALMDYMYNDASIYLQRKYSKFKEIEEYVHNKKAV